MNNPNWVKDELILALNFYFQEPKWRSYPKNHPKIAALSNLLNSLPFNVGEEKNSKYRNVNSVYMKLCNFLKYDDSYKGKGLMAGSKLEEIVWNEFSKDRENLENIAQNIKRFTTNGNQEVITPTDLENGSEAYEGMILTRVHSYRERNPEIVRKKKIYINKRYGKLECEVCKFVYEEKYGELGVGFIECHHIMPISDLVPGQKTRICDLSIICANCHRMIHRHKPWLNIEQLKRVISKKLNEKDNKEQ